MNKAIIIGAGIAGIATAIRLTIKGYRVVVFEANSYAGGKLSEIGNAGFRFDAGPSLFTMPQYIDELFKLAGKDPRAYFNYRKLPLVCKYFYEDGTEINAFADPQAFAEEIAAKTSDPAAKVQSFLNKSQEIYDITNHIFLEKSLHRISSFLSWKVLWSILRFRRIDPFRTMANANAAWFSDSKTQRFFNRYATYNGSDPYQAPATLNVIPHLEQHFGAYFPEGGMYAIVRSMLRLAEECGVQFRYDAKVDEILIKDRKAIGISVNRTLEFADLIVSNTDVHFTYKHLLKGFKMPAKVEKQERSSSALIFYWGISRQFPALDLHNIFFSENYQQEFEAIWKEKTISNDPTVYVNISSKLRPEDAPEGMENWFVMINVPSNSGQSWDELIAQSRRAIVAKLSRILKVDIDPLIVSEEILDPRSIEQRTSSYQGSLYGTSSNNQFAAFLRHANFSSRISRLYFTGGSVHPGGGIPLALLSARIVANLIPNAIPVK